MARIFHMTFKTDDSDGSWSEGEVSKQLARLEKRAEALGFEIVTYPEETPTEKEPE